MRVVVVVAAALLLSACPGNQRGEDLSQVAPSKTSTTTANPQAIPGNSTSMNPVSQSPVPAATVPTQVELTEYEIQMPDTLPAGQQMLHVVNGGHENHNLAIEGNGVTEKLTNDLTRGDAADMVVNLKPGTYTFYCPVENHRQRGMKRTVTVHQAPGTYQHPRSEANNVS